METLERPLPIASFASLLVRLAEAAGASLDALTSDASRERTARGAFQLEVERTDWLSQGLEAHVLREAGDNGATHHMAWEAHFHVEAEVTLPGAKLRFEGCGWGASELDRFSVEADPALASKLAEVVRAAV